MTFSVVRDGDRVVVNIPGQLVVTNRQELKQQVLDELGRGARTFVLDFKDTTYVDSAGLGTLVAMSKHIRQKVGELRLANVNVDLKHLLRLTRLDMLFRLEDDEGGSAGRPAALEPRPSGPLEGKAESDWPESSPPT